MSRLFIILGVLAVLAIGAYKLVTRRNHLMVKEKFSIEYLDKVRQYLDSRGQDVDAYGWLIHQSVKMQRNIGQLGLQLLI